MKFLRKKVVEATVKVALKAEWDVREQHKGLVSVLHVPYVKTKRLLRETANNGVAQSLIRVQPSTPIDGLE